MTGYCLLVLLDVGVESVPVAVEGMQDSQQTQNIQAGVLQVFSREFVSQEHHQRIGSVWRNSVRPELYRSFPLTVPLPTLPFLTWEQNII